MAVEEHPLASFVRFSPCVYVQEPEKGAVYDGKYPQTIVLTFWMNAPPRALAKYVVGYRRVAPAARIIFVLTSSNDFVFRFTSGMRQGRVAPAVEAIRASTYPDKPVFLHMFSNGGVSTATHLLAAYRKMTGRSLRISSMIIDSAPGLATVDAGMKAFSFIMPKQWILRFLSKTVLYTCLLLHSLFRKVTRTLDAVESAREAINDGRLLTGVGPKGCPERCYIYSDTDELVDARDVERHAIDAQNKGLVVHREKFFGTPHVSHMRVDPERYWAIVKRYLKQPGLE